MAYQVLARKYRPKGFDTLVGQEHVVQALSHGLDSGRVHHAYLFTGTRGVGKTTLSRILAKAFNCQGLDGNGSVTSQPCGQCDACIAIDSGRFVDYIEIDAASNRGVDEMAQLLEQAVYAPSNARFKVYMIDEVHMLTNHAFNAMLKTLEEPPSHVKFILATTDPQKIPVTVLSRCLQFNLKQMPPSHIIAHLSDILGQEGVLFETPALRLLAQGAQGSMRDALSLTDQAIAYSAGDIKLEAVQGMLGALDQSFLIKILDALSANDGAALIAVADDMATRSLSYSMALQDLGSLLHRIALAQMVPAAIADDLPERADVLRLAALFAPEEIQLFYQIAVHGRNELGLAPDDFAGFSMTLLRMLAFRPGMGGADGNDGNDRSSVAPRKKGSGVMSAGPAVSAVSDTTLASQETPVMVSRLAKNDDFTAALVLPTQLLPTQRSVEVIAAVSVGSASRANAAISPARAALEAARSASAGKMRGSSAAATPLANARALKPAIDGASSPITAIKKISDKSVPPWDDVPLDLSAERLADSSPEFSREFSSDTSFSVDNVSNISNSAITETSAVSIALPVEKCIPIAQLDWDGDWPLLVTLLPVRGVVQQLAQQSELLKCVVEGEMAVLHLQVVIETLRAPATVEKLASALTVHFSKTIRLTTQLGAVRHTAAGRQLAQRAEIQKQAEQTMQSDPFVQTLQREFGATIVPGSIKSISMN